MVARNLLITMSGGTTSVINATLAGVIKGVQKSRLIDKVYAGYPGILGLLEGKFLCLESIGEDALRRLILTPASGSIGTTRVEPITDNQIKKIEDIAERLGVGYFINIGGNGTIRQSVNLAKRTKHLKVAALPKTVDNDLGDKEFKEVLFTPGFLSCVQYWYHKVKIFNEENLGAFSHDRVLIAQTFGRETGFIAGAARLADPGRKLPLILLLPEDQQSLKRVISKIRQTINKSNRALVVMSEGYEIGDIGARHDPSGQIMYSSSRTTNAQILINKLADNGIQARGFIPGFDQRSEILFVSKRDIQFAKQVGEYAIKEFEEGKEGFFVTVAAQKGSKYKPQIKSILLSGIKDFSRRMPRRWIQKGKFDVTRKYVDYLENTVDLRSPFFDVPLGKIDFVPTPIGEYFYARNFKKGLVREGG